MNFSNTFQYLFLGGWLDKKAEELQNGIYMAFIAFQNMISELLRDGIRMALDLINSMFNQSVMAMKSEIALTPSDFDENLVTNLRGISDTAMLPIAGLIITYMFCYEIYTQITEKNKGGEYEIQSLFYSILKTAICVKLVTSAFTIALGFSDLGTWIIDTTLLGYGDKITVDSELSDTILEDLKPYAKTKDIYGNDIIVSIESYFDLEEQEDIDAHVPNFQLGKATIVLVIAVIALIATMIMIAIIYLVAWSRMIMILLYVTVAPIPMATLMSKEWMGGIGQNYIKNLMALTLQGFFMLVLLVIYAGLLNHTATIVSEEGDAIMAMVLMLVSMALIVKLLSGTHQFAKSITGAN